MGCQQSKAAAVELPPTMPQSCAPTTEKVMEKASGSSARSSSKIFSTTRPEEAEPTMSSSHHEEPGTPPTVPKETTKKITTTSSAKPPVKQPEAVVLMPPGAPEPIITTTQPPKRALATPSPLANMCNSPMVPKSPLTPRGSRRRKTLSTGIREMAAFAGGDEPPGPESPWVTHSVGYMGPTRTIGVEDLFQLGAPLLPTLGEICESPLTELQPKAETRITGRTCAGCNKPETNAGVFKVCAKCRDVVYCAKDCQRAHWKEHKKDCSADVAGKDSFSSEEGEAKPEALIKEADNAAAKELEDKLIELRRSPGKTSAEEASLDTASSKGSSTASELTAPSKDTSSEAAVDENLAPAKPKAAATTTKATVRKCSGCPRVEDSAGTFKECAKCRSNIVYCARTCQKKHWKEHKKTCCKGPSVKDLGGPKQNTVAGTVNVAGT